MVPAGFTSENHRQWRSATVKDAGGTIVYCDDCGGGEFGEFDDLDEEPDEEFPDVTYPVSVVYSQSGNMIRRQASNGVFEDIKVVPESVMKGFRDEAPPGKLFSGISVRNSSKWTPAPEGKVWFEHPFFENGQGRHVSYLEHFILKRTCAGLGSTHYGADGTIKELSRNAMLEHDLSLWLAHGRMEFWCPVKKKFMSEGEMLRQEAWFHNGDGSAQRRRYHTQFEMMDRYGGEIGIAADDDSVIIAAVKTPEDRANERYLNALRNGQVTDLTSGDKSLRQRSETFELWLACVGGEASL